ncbi:hypothetical protein [Cryptosporangium minutisporangium]|uniref:Methyltransferase n=1 Tax=Cryptosporangium minutisporangium TaxID=113569 RepID=A0ABP6TBE2_9ACTN
MNKALMEFHRVLLPGGRIAMSEMIKATDASPAKRPFPQAREPMTADQWIKEFEAAGFLVEELIHCGPRRYVNSGKHLLNRHEEVSGLLVDQFGEKVTAEIRDGMQEAFHLGPEHVNYLILCARKRWFDRCVLAWPVEDLQATPASDLRPGDRSRPDRTPVVEKYPGGGVGSGLGRS